MKQPRLDKFLADSREGTRSEVKEKIRKGCVRVNGTVCKDPSTHVGDGDEVTVDGRRVQYSSHVYYMLNKPAGYVSATEDKSEKTVLDLFPEDLRKRLFPVGRLDKDSVGLLIVCDDGELNHRLTSPAKHVDKRYMIRTDVPVTDEDIAAFKSGITLSDGTVLKEAHLEASDDDPHEAYVTISEGKYHQIKRMIASCGKKVTYLKRLSVGDVVLDPKLSEGQYRPLSNEELKKLQK